MPGDGEHLFTASLKERALGSFWISATPLRDRALFHLFWEWAPPLPQVIALRPEHVDLKARRLRWPLPVPSWEEPEAEFSLELAEALTRYLHRERPTRASHLFVTTLGHPLAPRHLVRFFRHIEEATRIPVTPPAWRLAHLKHRSLERWLERLIPPDAWP
ncbi:MAG: hypothetical protein QJR00_05045 [Bacillota bacterium]|nr:hypothetical protein [Bacillota bacterium]